MKFNGEQITKAAEILEGAKVVVLNRDFDDFQNAIITALNTFALVKELTEENERLKKDNEYILMQHAFQRRPSGDCWNDVIEKAKTDTVRKMQDKLNAAVIKHYGKLPGYKYFIDIIDMIAKETLEENNV